MGRENMNLKKNGHGHATKMAAMPIYGKKNTLNLACCIGNSSLVYLNGDQG